MDTMDNGVQRFAKGDKVWLRTREGDVVRGASGFEIDYEITHVIPLGSGDMYVLATGGREGLCHCGGIGYTAGCLVRPRT